MIVFFKLFHHIDYEVNENECLILTHISTVIRFGLKFTEHYVAVHKACALVLSTYVERVLDLWKNNTASFRSLWIGTYVPHTYTHTHTLEAKMLTVLNRAASLSLKPLKCGSSSSSPSAV